MNQKLVSIVIPTLNCKEIIRRAIDSISDQNFADLEVIISDGGSSDGTVDFTLNTLNSKKIHASAVIYPGSSIYQAINLGIKLAQGEWIYVLGSDDRLYQSDILQRIASHLLNSKADVLYGDAWAGDTDGFLLGGQFDLNRLCRENICHQAIFYRRNTLVALGVEYDDNYELLADWNYNVRLLSHCRFQHVPIIIAFFTGTGRSSTGRDYAFERDRERNILRYFGIRSIFMLHPIQFQSIAATARRPFQGILRTANKVTFPLYRRFALMRQGLTTS
jgi:glycosyltransferase involved in cell wall biosynthesis